MEQFSFYSVIFINLIIGVHYCVQTIRRKINPSLAMWVFFTIAVTGSLFAYLLEGDFSPRDNILNTADIVLCAFISVVILFFGVPASRFNRFDLFCLGAVILILFYWFFFRAHFATHLSLQLIQVIAYFPVVRRMWKAKENNESFVSWILLFLASLVSLFSARGALAFVYSIRALVCVSLLLLLMIRLELKSRSFKRISASG